MILLKTLKSIILIGSASLLVSCASIPLANQTDCSPTPPQLEWYTVEDGGVYCPQLSFVNQQLYIKSLEVCIDEYRGI